MRLRHRLLPDPSGPNAWLAAIGAGLVIGLPVGGAAEPADEQTGPATYRLAPALARPELPAWMGEGFTFRRGAGLEYRRELKLGEHPIQLGLHGPIVRKKKSVGLTFELRF